MKRFDVVVLETCLYRVASRRNSIQSSRVGVDRRCELGLSRCLPQHRATKFTRAISFYNLRISSVYAIIDPL